MISLLSSDSVIFYPFFANPVWTRRWGRPWLLISSPSILSVVCSQTPSTRGTGVAPTHSRWEECKSRHCPGFVDSFAFIFSWSSAFRLLDTVPRGYLQIILPVFSVYAPDLFQPVHPIHRTYNYCTILYRTVLAVGSYRT